MRIPDRNMTPPEESAEDSYVNMVIRQVEMLKNEIDSMIDELADFKVFTHDFHYLSSDAKREVIESYDQKINNRQSKLDGIKRNLANSYGVVI